MRPITPCHPASRMGAGPWMCPRTTDPWRQGFCASLASRFAHAIVLCLQVLLRHNAQMVRQAHTTKSDSSWKALASEAVLAAVLVRLLGSDHQRVTEMISLRFLVQKVGDATCAGLMHASRPLATLCPPKTPGRGVNLHQPPQSFTARLKP